MQLVTHSLIRYKIKDVLNRYSTMSRPQTIFFMLFVVQRRGVLLKINNNNGWHPCSFWHQELLSSL